MIHLPVAPEVNAASRHVIDAALEVHRCLGPGLLESTYENATCLELDRRGVAYARQPAIVIQYKGITVGHYRPDLIVCNAAIVEIKSVEHLTPLFEAQILAYLRSARLRVGLLINFNSALLKDGIKRVIL